MQSDQENFLIAIADELTERELSNGAPWPDGPSASEFRKLCPLLLAAGEVGQPGRTAEEAWTLMNAIAVVSDKWLNPERDPIGSLIRPILEQIVDNLGRKLDRALPATATQRAQWSALRAKAHRIQKRIHYENARPSLLRHLLLRVFGGTRF